MAFDSTSYSLLKTVVMMIGEYEFEGIFTEHDDPEHTEQQEIEEAAGPGHRSLGTLAADKLEHLLEVEMFNH